MSQNDPTHTDELDADLDTEEVTDTPDSDQLDDEITDTDPESKLSRREKAILKSEKKNKDLLEALKSQGIDVALLRNQTQSNKAETLITDLGDTFYGDKSTFKDKYAELVESGLPEDKAKDVAVQLANLEADAQDGAARRRAALPVNAKPADIADRVSFTKQDLANLWTSDPKAAKEVTRKHRQGEVSIT